MARIVDFPRRYRIIASANELVKSVAFYFSAEAEISHNNAPMASYAIYYALFHVAQFNILMDSRIPTKDEDWVADNLEDAISRRKATPFNHDVVIKMTRSSTSTYGNLLDTLENALHLRNFYSYGPKLSKNGEYNFEIHVGPYIDLMRRLPNFVQTLHRWYAELPSHLEGVSREDLTLLFIQIWELKRMYLESFQYPQEVQMKCHQLFTEMLDAMEKRYVFMIASERLDRGIDD